MVKMMGKLNFHSLVNPEVLIWERKHTTSVLAVEFGTGKHLSLTFSQSPDGVSKENFLLHAGSKG